MDRTRRRVEQGITAYLDGAGVERFVVRLNHRGREWTKEGFRTITKAQKWRESRKGRIGGALISRTGSGVAGGGSVVHGLRGRVVDDGEGTLEAIDAGGQYESRHDASPAEIRGVADRAD